MLEHLFLQRFGEVLASAAKAKDGQEFTASPVRPSSEDYFRQVKAFVQGVTPAAVGAIAGAAYILARRLLIDIPTVIIGIVTLTVLMRESLVFSCTMLRLHDEKVICPL